jgi:hypothetical protein
VVHLGLGNAMPLADAFSATTSAAHWRSARATLRRGVASRDVVTAIAIGVLLVSFGLPWIVSRREATRRTQCESKLHELALACVNYEDIYLTFPPAVTVFSLGRSFRSPPDLSATPQSDPWISTGIENGMIFAGPNWAMQVAGQIDLQLYRETMSCMVELIERERQPRGWNPSDDCEHTGAGVGSFHPMGTPDFMVCPTATPARRPHTSLRTQLENLAKGNYAACLGSGTYFESIDYAPQVDAILEQRAADAAQPGDASQIKAKRGVITVRFLDPPKYNPEASQGLWQFGRGRGTVLRKLVDGAENTVILSEVLTVDGEGMIAGASDDIRGVWVSPSMGGSTYTHQLTPNSTVSDQINGCETDVDDLPPKIDLRCVEQRAWGPTAGDTFAAARSQHLGGVMAATADAATHFYANEIDAKVWAALATRGGND